MKNTVLLEGTTVGEIFQKAREQRGLTLTMVSKELMIRKFYLNALEEGRYHELPSSVYAVGFVKSYSEFLGIETDKLVEQFCRERGGAGQRTELVFPEMVTESKLPSYGVILGGLVSAVVVLFIGAAILGEDKENELVTIPEPAISDSEVLPNTVAPVVQEGTTDNLPNTLVSSEPTVVISGVGDGVDSQNAVAPSLEAQSSAQNQDANSNNVQPTETATTSVDLSVKSEQGIADTATVAPSEIPSAVITTPDLAQDNANTIINTPSNSQEKVENVTVKSSGTLNAGAGIKSRITVASSQESWIEIRDREGVLLLTRVLQPGQRYDVPDEKGITMMTGNAGGIFLIVDGKQLPPLGQPSMVKRNIKLDADLYQ